MPIGITLDLVILNMPTFNVQKTVAEIIQGVIQTIDRVAEPAPFFACKDNKS